MGYYIPNDIPIYKREGIQLLPAVIPFDEIPEDKVLICAVNNGWFNAYGYAYSKEELEVFADQRDGRPKMWYLMDKKEAHKLCGYEQK